MGLLNDLSPSVISLIAVPNETYPRHRFILYYYNAVCAESKFLCKLNDKPVRQVSLSSMARKIRSRYTMYTKGNSYHKEKHYDHRNFNINTYHKTCW